MKVKFMPSGEEHEIEVNESVLHLANRVGLHIQSVCKGIPSCAECRVQIIDGEHHVLPPNKKEIDLIGTAHYVDMSRLSCQLRCFGDVTIDLSEQIAKEARAQQKPKDRMTRRDGKESHAVLGGILDNIVAADEELPPEIEAKVEKIAVEHVQGDPNLDRRDNFYGDFYTGKKKSDNRHRDRQRGGRHSGQGSQERQASVSAASGPEGSNGDKPKRKRRRRKKPQQGQPKESQAQGS